jgi:RimJ/RimL family protein N-acetyltransferase
MPGIITVRLAKVSDAKILFDWRNNPNIRAASEQTKPLIWEDHIRWLIHTLQSGTQHVFIGEQDGFPIGVVRFSVEHDHALVSLALAPAAQGKGFGKCLLALGMAQIGSMPIRARIRSDNAASRTCFAACGFVETSQDKGFCCYNYIRLTFEEIVPKDDHINALYEALKLRKHAISHINLPSFKDHQEFIKKHPYRSWNFVFAATECIANFYLQNDNSIGVHLIPGYDHMLPVLLKQILHDYDPLPEIKSKRNAGFVLHVPIGDHERRAQMNANGHTPLQITYTLEKERV